jgi:hypothetical protein
VKIEQDTEKILAYENSQDLIADFLLGMAAITVARIRANALLDFVFSSRFRH